ncbi:MAG: hypothetical protein EZS28_055421, partial [Streblomastix strix]
MQEKMYKKQIGSTPRGKQCDAPTNQQGLSEIPVESETSAHERPFGFVYTLKRTQDEQLSSPSYAKESACNPGRPERIIQSIKPTRADSSINKNSDVGCVS